MASRGFYSHVDPQGQDVAGRLAAVGYLAVRSAENLARGQPNANDVVAGWMDSPGHRANILNPELRAIGAGYAFTPNDEYHHYWTHVFATPDPVLSRDRSRYPAELVAAINQERAKAGRPTLTRTATLEALARSHLTALARGGANAFQSQARRTLEAVSQAAATSAGRAAAQVAAGSPTPEAVVAEWMGGEGRSQLLDAAYREAGAAYVFNRDDSYRHYWLVVLAGPR
jgi:uncharacterized protein YkwD